MSYPRPARIISLLLILAALFATSPAAAQGFGKNKVQYDPLEWAVLQTPHIRLHYYAQEESLARRVAVVAESVCVEYDERFRLSLKHEIPFFLFSAHHMFQQTNATPGMISEGVGGLTELIKGRVLVPHNGSWNRLVWVTRHELAHAYMLEKISRVMKEHRRPQPYLPPLWFIEGLAEYCGSQWDEDAEGLIRDAVLSNEALPLTRSEAITGTVLMYKEGQSFLLHLAEKYGTDKPFEMLDAWHRAENFEELFRVTTGRSVHDEDAEWFDNLKKRYYPAVTTTDKVAMIARKVPTHGRYTLGPRVVPVGPDSSFSFCYFSADELGIELRISQDHGRGERRDLTLLKSGTTPQFESFHLFQNRPGASRSGKIVLSSKKGGRDALYMLDARRNGKLLRTVNSNQLVGILDPSIVPGDSAVVFSAQDYGGRMDLFRWTWPGGKSKIERLTNDEADDLEPCVSPDGKWVAFASDRGISGARHALFRLSLADGSIEQLSEPFKGEDRQPVYSPDGKWIAFRSTRAGTSDLWVRPAEPSREARRVTRTRGPVYDPDWLASGKGLLFCGQEAIQFKAYAIQFDPDTLAVEHEGPLPVAMLATVPAMSDSGPFLGLGHPPAQVPPPGVHSGPSLEYQRRLGLDLFQNSFGYDPTFSSAGTGTQIAFSDMLGNEQIYVSIGNSAERFGNFWDNWEGGVTYINQSRRLHYGVGAFRLTQTYDQDLDVVVRERRFGALGLLSYPFHKFLRIEGSVVARHSNEHRLRSGEVRPLDLVTNGLALIQDNTVWTMAGPTRGSRWYLSAAYTRDLTTGMGNYGSLQAEYRTYFQPLPLTISATRMVARSSFGPDAQQSYLGGLYTLRGFDWRALSGERTLAVQQEFRAPLLRGVVLGFPGTFPLPPIGVAGFGDAGFAWGWDSTPGSLIPPGNRFGARTLGSAGFGIYIGGGVYPSIRWNWAWRTPDFEHWTSKPIRQFLIAYDF